MLLAFLAYGVYRLIWRHFATPRATLPDPQERNPFKQNAVALAIPVFIAMAPSILLGYTEVKTYFVVTGTRIAVVLCIAGALKDPDVNLDPGTRGYWFNVAMVAIFVMMTLVLQRRIAKYVLLLFVFSCQRAIAVARRIKLSGSNCSRKAPCWRNSRCKY